MPTVNPRVQVTLSPSLDALVLRLAVHQRSSKSQVLRELLEAAEPALQRAAALMDAASTAAGEAKARLVRMLDSSQDAAEDAVAVLNSRLDRMTDDLVSQAEAIRGRRPARKGSPSVPGAPAVARNPPPSNRGVKSGKRAAASPPSTPVRRRSNRGSA